MKESYNPKAILMAQGNCSWTYEEDGAKYDINIHVYPAESFYIVDTRKSVGGELLNELWLEVDAMFDPDYFNEEYSEDEGIIAYINKHIAESYEIDMENAERRKEHDLAMKISEAMMDQLGHDVTWHTVTDANNFFEIRAISNYGEEDVWDEDLYVIVARKWNLNEMEYGYWQDVSEILSFADSDVLEDDIYEYINACIDYYYPEYPKSAQTETPLVYPLAEEVKLPWFDEIVSAKISTAEDEYGEAMVIVSFDNEYLDEPIIYDSEDLAEFECKEGLLMAVIETLNEDDF